MNEGLYVFFLNFRVFNYLVVFLFVWGSPFEIRYYISTSINN